MLSTTSTRAVSRQASRRRSAAHAALQEAVPRGGEPARRQPARDPVALRVGGANGVVEVVQAARGGFLLEAVQDELPDPLPPGGGVDREQDLGVPPRAVHPPVP